MRSCQSQSLSQAGTVGEGGAYLECCWCVTCESRRIDEPWWNFERAFVKESGGRVMSVEALDSITRSRKGGNLVTKVLVKGD